VRIECVDVQVIPEYRVHQARKDRVCGSEFALTQYQMIERAIDRPQAKGHLHVGKQGGQVRPSRVCFLWARSEGSAATLRHSLYRLTTSIHVDIHSLYGFPMQRPVPTLYARRPPCALVRGKSSVHQ
jgi:hypothetical protein